METNHWIEISRRVYARLLNLYPEKHRIEYGADMLQVFTDQCRSINRARKDLGIIVLWIRTLIDLGINVFREHLTSPHSSLGLLEAVPNEPLPWKGVALVLVPGLIFFVSQIAQLTGEDWFFLMVYRAAYFMIIPVLIVWVWKRKFPIWGLIPLGLLFTTLLNVLSRLNYIFAQIPALALSNPLLGWLDTVAKAFPFSTRNAIIALVLLLAILVLFWSVKRRMGIPGRAWVWLGIFVLLVILNILATGREFISIRFISLQISSGPNLEYQYLFDLTCHIFYTYGGFLVLILLGALLAGRHGRLAVLLPLGYLLPTLIYGRISNEWPNPATPEFLFMLSVSAAALAYRFLVALAGPLWIVRSATGQMQKRASVASLVILIAIQAAFNLGLLFTSGRGGDQLTNIYFAISEQLIVGAGIALALVLYQRDPPDQTTQKQEELIPDSASGE